MHGTSFGVIPRTGGPLGRSLGWAGERDLARRRKIEPPREALTPEPRPDPEPVVDLSLLRVVVPWSGRWLIRDMIRLAAAAFGTTEGAIKSPLKIRSLCRARQTAMFLCRRFAQSSPAYSGACSFPEIGRRFGDRDHTTVMHAVAKVEGIVRRRGIDGGTDPHAWAQLLASVPAEDWR